MIEVRLLQHAIAVADEASFALAAQALGLSQPALSRSIQSLETQLGVQLFERGHRRIEPTDIGRLFLERARELLQRHVMLADEMGLMRRDAPQSVSIVVGPYVAELVAGPAVARTAKQYPHVQFQLRVDGWSEAVKCVRARECDLAIADCSQLHDDPDLEAMALGKNQGYLVVRSGHPLLAEGASGLEQALGYPLVSTGRLPPRILAPLLQHSASALAASDAGFPAILCEQVSVMREIVAQSNVVGMFTLSLIEDQLEAGLLTLLPYALPWLHTQFGVIHRRNRPLSPPAQVLVDNIRQASEVLASRDCELRQRFAADLPAG